jgi:hypothetical protein
MWIWMLGIYVYEWKHATRMNDIDHDHTGGKNFSIPEQICAYKII